MSGLTEVTEATMATRDGGDAAPTVTLSLSSQDITLLRCGLLRRMDNLIGRPECEASYNRSKELLEILWDARKTLD